MIQSGDIFYVSNNKVPVFILLGPSVVHNFNYPITGYIGLWFNSCVDFISEDWLLKSLKNDLIKQRDK